MPTKTDRELLAAWRETGDESAFAELVARHRQMVYRTTVRMLGNVHDTEDAVQAVFVVLAQKADRLQREGSLGGWLHTVTRHVAMQALARRASHARREEELAMWHETAIEESAPEVDTSTVLRCLDQELAGLSAVLRQAVVLRYLQGNSEKAAAELAGCPLGTLSRRTSQGLAKLRQRLTKRGVALSGVALAGLLTSEASAAVPETLIPSILATVKSAVATTAMATGLPGVALGAKTGTSTAAMLAKGAMKAMFIAKVKTPALVTAAASLVVAAAVVVAQEVPQRKAAEQPAGTSSQDAEWASRDIVLSSLKTWGTRHYTYSRLGPGGRATNSLGNVSLSTELADDGVILKDKFQGAFKGKNVSLEIIHTCRKDNFLSPTRIESKGEGDDEVATFVATVSKGKAMVRTQDGRQNVSDFPDGTITMAAMVRLVTLVPRTPGKTYTYKYSLESEEMNLKENYRLNVLPPETITIGDRQELCAKFMLTGGGIRPVYYWVTNDGVLQRLMMDDRKVLELDAKP